MNRRTKIVATIGPASEDEATLRAMIRAGMDVARLGLAHNTIDEGLERFHRIRKVSEEEGHRAGILVDLPGPKVRGELRRHRCRCAQRFLHRASCRRGGVLC